MRRRAAATHSSSLVRHPPPLSRGRLFVRALTPISVCARADKGVVYAFGRGRNGQLGRGDHVESVAAHRTLPVEVTSLKGKHVTKLGAGENHSLAIVKS